MENLKHIKRFNESDENFNTYDVSDSLNRMTSSEIKRYIKNNFVATRSNLEKLVDATKNLTREEMMSINYSLGMTAGGLYCMIMKNKYGIVIPV